MMQQAHTGQCGKPLTRAHMTPCLSAASVICSEAASSLTLSSFCMGWGSGGGSGTPAFSAASVISTQAPGANSLSVGSAGTGSCMQ